MTIRITEIVILLVISIELCTGVLQINYDRTDKICIEQSKQPYFDIQIVVGKPWRIYYTWNVDMGNKCLDMVVKNATSSTINRFYNDMHDYLQTQPEWDAATLLVRMGSAKHEVLMFAAQGSEGYFLGVPNVIKSGNISPTRRAVPLLKFFIKLVHDRSYLLMLDCQIGVASLMSRQRPLSRTELEKVAKSLNLGDDGMHACLDLNGRNNEARLKK